VNNSKAFSDLLKIREKQVGELLIELYSLAEQADTELRILIADKDGYRNGWDEAEKIIVQLRSDLAETHATIRSHADIFLKYEKDIEEAVQIIKLSSNIISESIHDSYYSSCNEYNKNVARIDAFLARTKEKK
jgi:hypothetical protein